MTDSEFPTVSDVFKLLNRWRHLPGYPLEGRSAPFFALFLRDVLSEHFDTEMHPVVIPEFPLRQGTLDSDDSNLSYNVDYVAFSKDKGTAYLVELKTDMDSKRPKQDEYLCKARDTDFNCLVRGVKALAKASKSKRKYGHLLHQLSLAGFVSDTSGLEDLYGKSRSNGQVARGWTKAIKALTIGDKTRSRPEVVFIQPVQHKSDKSYFKYIYFKQVAKIVKTKGDLGKQFAECLLQWQIPPGYRHPRKFSRRS